MGLHENLQSEPISSLALRRALTADGGITAREACGLMRDAKVGCIIIVGDSERPTGMFNEKLLIRMLSDRPAAMDRAVSESMTTNLTTLRHDEPIVRLIRTMQQRHLRWVCIVDDAGRPIGLGGLRGVMEYVVDHFPRFVKVEPIQTNLAMKQREGA